MLLRREEVEEVHAAPMVAAEKVIARELHLVDELGNVLVEATTKDDDGGARFSVYGPHREQVVTVRVDGDGAQVYIDGGNDSDVVVYAGGECGPAIHIRDGNHRRVIDVSGGTEDAA